MFLDNHFYCIDNFLTQPELDELLEIVESNKENFTPTTTATAQIDYRKSVVLAATFYSSLFESWRHRLYGLLPRITTELLHPYFIPTDFEMQLTATNDGEYYKTHNDNGHDICKNREITYVYYFNREPKAFEEGYLQMYPTDTSKMDLVLPDEGSKLIEPKSNQIIFFDSRLMHQVLPTIVKSKDFMDSRFTINGWFKS
jgi:SM-20-related protein